MLVVNAEKSQLTAVVLNANQIKRVGIKEYMFATKWSIFESHCF